MQFFRTLLLASVLPFAACVSDNTSSTAQLIECTDTGAGVTGCHAVSADDNAPGTCVDRDEDDDGSPHDEGPDDSGNHSSSAGDSDDDGVSDDRDCDHRSGGDDDDGADDPAGHDAGDDNP